MHDFWMLVHFGFLEWWRCAWLFCFWKVCPSSFFRCICSFLLVEPLIWLSAQKIIGTWQCSWRNAMAVGLDKPLLGKNGSKAWQWAFTCFDIVKGSFWQQPMPFESVWLWKLEGEVGSTVTATAECPEPQISEPMESGLRLLVENAWGHQSLEEHGWRRPIECPRLDVLFTEQGRTGKKMDGFCFVIRQDAAKYSLNWQIFFMSVISPSPRSVWHFNTRQWWEGCWSCCSQPLYALEDSPKPFCWLQSSPWSLQQIRHTQDSCSLATVAPKQGPLAKLVVSVKWP